MTLNGLKDSVAKIFGISETYPKTVKSLKNFVNSKYSKDFNYSAFPEIDIIMPTFNRENVTLRIINNLYESTKIKFNLIVVDNKSNNRDSVKELVESKPNATFIQLDENGGGAVARAEGLKHSKNKIVAFLDNDIYIMPLYFEYLLETLLNNPNLAGVQSKVVYPNEIIQLNRPYYNIENEWVVFYDKDVNKRFDDQTSEVSEECNWMPSGATLWNKEILTKFEFDESFKTSFEDNELTYRMSKEGYKFMNSYKSLCIHFSSEFTPSSVNRSYSAGRFGDDIPKKTAKFFYEKHGLLFSFGPPAEFVKHLGFSNIDEYRTYVTT